METVLAAEPYAARPCEMARSQASPDRLRFEPFHSGCNSRISTPAVSGRPQGKSCQSEAGPFTTPARHTQYALLTHP